MTKSNKPVTPRAIAIACAVFGFAIAGQPSEARAECSPTAYVGSICITAGVRCPRDYIDISSRQIVRMEEYPVLYAVVQDNYYSDAGVPRGYFSLPSTNGRILIGEGTDRDRTEYELGEYIGRDTKEINSSHLPPHDHAAKLTVNKSVPVAMRASNAPGTLSVPQDDGKSLKGETVRGTDAQASFATGLGANKAVRLGGVTTRVHSDVEFSVKNTGNPNSKLSTLQPQMALRLCVMADGGEWPVQPR